jgi:type IV pilus assembly protein PilE
MKKRFKAFQGFTLVELMIAVAIIGILAAVVYPSYQSHIRKSRRADAKVALAELALIQEDFRARSGSGLYAGNFTSLFDRGNYGFTINGTNVTSKEGYYKITLLVLPGGFRLQAKVDENGLQKDDMVNCNIFTIDHQSVRTSANEEGNPTDKCW